MKAYLTSMQERKGKSFDKKYEKELNEAGIPVREFEDRKTGKKYRYVTVKTMQEMQTLLDTAGDINIRYWGNDGLRKSICYRITVMDDSDSINE